MFLWVSVFSWSHCQLMCGLADIWIRLCTSSLIGRRLSLFFCFLLIDSHLGANAKYLPGDENFIADAISRIKQQKGIHNFFYDYSSLKQNYPIFENCRSFQPSQELLSMLWTIILSENMPTLSQVRTLTQQGFYHITSILVNLFMSRVQCVIYSLFEVALAWLAVCVVVVETSLILC